MREATHITNAAIRSIARSSDEYPISICFILLLQ